MKPIFMLLYFISFGVSAQNSLTMDKSEFFVLGVDSVSSSKYNVLVVGSEFDTLVFVVPKSCSQLEQITKISASLTFKLDDLSFRKREYPIKLKSGLVIPPFVLIYNLQCE